jgi:hypothetical protein
MTDLTATDIRELNEKIKQESSFIDLINIEIGKTIVGQKQMIESLRDRRAPPQPLRK